MSANEKYYRIDLTHTQHWYQQHFKSEQALIEKVSSFTVSFFLMNHGFRKFGQLIDINSAAISNR